MASTITNFTGNIDTAFPVPGVDNDTQGFRNNFSNIRDGLLAAKNEIEDLQLIQDGLIVQVNSISTPENIAASGIISTNITATNVTANGIVRASTFIGDGSQLTGITIGSALASLSVAGSLTAGNTNILGVVTATSARINGTVQAAQFVGDGSQLTGIVATYTNLQSLATLALPTTDISSKNITANGTVTAQRFVGDGSGLTNLPAASQGNLSRLTVTGNSVFGGTLTLSAALSSTSTISAKSLSLTDTLSVTTATASYFVGDGSGLTNVSISSAYTVSPAVGLNTKSLTLVSANNASTSSLYTSNQTLYVTDVTQVVVVSTLTFTTTLSSWGGSGGTLDLNQITVASVSGVGSGATQYNVFKLWPGDPEFHPVVSVAGNTVTTTSFDPSNAEAAGVTNGSTVTFYRTNSPSMGMYATAAPTSPKGQAGDKKGMFFQTATKLYVCYADYTNGVPDIWAARDGFNNTIP